MKSIRTSSHAVPRSRYVTARTAMVGIVGAAVDHNK